MSRCRRVGRAALVLVLVGGTSLIQAGPAGAGDGYDSFGCYEFYDAGSYEAGSNGMLDDDPGLVATTGTFFHGNGGSCTSGVAGYDCRSATDLYELDGTWVKYAGGWRTCVGDGDDGTAVHLINGHDDADGNRSLHVSRIYISGVAHDSYPIVLEVGT